jgi:hypothetical protein
MARNGYQSLTLGTILFLSAGVVAHSQALLDNFSTARSHYGNPGALWDVYNGDSDCTGQTWSVNANLGTASIPGGNSCPYVHFFPDGSAGYAFPMGFAQYYVMNGPWNPNYNRLNVLMNCSASFAYSGGDGIATYVKGQTAPGGNFQGQHYYHGFAGTVTAGHWTKVTINNHPNHRVGGIPTLNWPSDPEWVMPTTGAPVRYFDGLTRFYLNPTRLHLANAYTCSFTDASFDYVSNEPDEYVYSLSATYTGSVYNVDWLGPKGDTTYYEVRYSTTGSLKTLGFSSGSVVSVPHTSGDSYNQVHAVTNALSEAPGIWFGIRPRPAIIGASGQGTSPIRITTALDVLLSAGDQVTVSSVAGNTAANGTWSVTPVPRKFWFMGNGLVSFVAAGGNVTVTTLAPHGLVPGQVVMALQSGATAPNALAYGSNRTVISTPSPTTFVMSVDGLPDGTYSDTSLQIWSLPALDLANSAGSGAYTGGGNLIATSDKTNFSEIYLPALSSGLNFTPCDVNYDGVVDSVDVGISLDQSLAKRPCANDLNGDGQCNVIDLQRVINTSSGGSCQTSR